MKDVTEAAGQGEFPAVCHYVDCRGLTADAVARQLIAAWGFDERFWRTRDTPLADAFRKWTSSGERAVVGFGNVQWAGGTATSTEPERVLRHVVVPLLRHAGCPVAVLVEIDQPQERVPLASVLPGQQLLPFEVPDVGTSVGHDLLGVLARFPQVWALAAAEIRDVPLPAWSTLCTALGLPGDPAVLNATVSALPGILMASSADTRPDDAEGGGEGADDAFNASCVAFLADGMRHLLRNHRPFEAAEHARIADVLLDRSLRRSGVTVPWREHDRVTRYAAHALPLHCAAAGTLPELAQDPGFLANVDRLSLLTGLALVYPDGIPHDVPALDVHYLEEAGVEPSTHEEWVCWLHWALMNRGATGFAARLAHSAGDLPWLTHWSRWRPYASFGPSAEHDIARADEAVVGVVNGTDVVAGQLEIDEDGFAGGAGADAEEWFEERLWRLDDGTPLGDAVQVALYYDDDGDVERAVGRVFEPVEVPEELDSRPVPRAPSSSSCLAAAADGTLVYGGQGGVFVLGAPDQARVVSAPRWRSRPLLGAHNRAEAWPMPVAVRAGNQPAQEWYENAFGEGTCRIASRDDLPAGVTHPDTVRFLTEVGLPDFEGALPYVSFVSPQALAEVTDPAVLPPAAGPGPFFHLGNWARGGLLLDGTSGRVHTTYAVDGAEERLLSGGLRQLCTLLALSTLRVQSDFTVWAEEVDAKRSLRAWAQRIDPLSSSHPHWAAVLSGHWDDRDVL
ncbi:SUKH-4 family immunity protein [Streptomyces sp. NPDC007100]|uniref:SUKH-4 family immunity protein n=1 Tax=Streptomyces sp. NPDC007100 TaxID=3155602 RepID=UPI003400D3FE